MRMERRSFLKTMAALGCTYAVPTKALSYTQPKWDVLVGSAFTDSPLIRQIHQLPGAKITRLDDYAVAQWHRSLTSLQGKQVFGFLDEANFTLFELLLPKERGDVLTRLYPARRENLAHKTSVQGLIQKNESGLLTWMATESARTAPASGVAFIVQL